MTERQEEGWPRYNKSFSRWLLPAVIGVIIFGGTTFGILSVISGGTQTEVRQSLFEQQKERQLETTKALADHIGSDLDSVSLELLALSNIDVFQQGDLSSDVSSQLVQQYFQRAKEQTSVDILFIIDKNNVITEIAGSPGVEKFKGSDLSSRAYVQKTKETMGAVFSDGFFGLDGKYRVVVTQPIVNRQTGQYVGLAGASLSTIDFFARYGNIYQIKAQYLAALDTQANQLIHGNPDLIGKGFFDEATQKFTDHNKDLNDAMHKVLSGQSASALYTIAAGERLTSGYPILVNNKLIYVIFIITPTSLIYSNIDGILTNEQNQLFDMQVALAIVVGLFATLAVWLNRNLNAEVTRRTQDLEYSNGRLAQANTQLEMTNEQLKVHDKLQKEFVNVAAHELRTPIQPLLGAAELIESQFDEQDEIKITRPEVEMILRNAKRLERLSSDILEISRIDSGALKLYKETFSLSYIIAEAIIDAKTQSNFDPNMLSISYIPDDIFVHADREKITEVITNLLTNAIKFTEKGKITITTQKNNQDKFVLVSIEDTGSGIAGEIMPRLFEKFVTRSEKGTGIGLYISKKIVEAHGGVISGRNNPTGSGATFQFTLPILESDKQVELEKDKKMETPATKPSTSKTSEESI
jgi:signal transduction histidine kinase